VRDTGNWDEIDRNVPALKVGQQCQLMLLTKGSWRHGKTLGSEEDKATRNGLRVPAHPFGTRRLERRKGVGKYGRKRNEICPVLWLRNR
jgi:hypothetical protein